MKKNLPKLVSEHKSYLSEFGLNDELVKLVLKQGKVEDFKTLSKVIESPELIAKSLTLFQKEIARKEGKPLEEVNGILDAHVLEAILEEVGGKISKNDVRTVMQKIVRGESLDEAMEKSDVDLREEVEKFVKENPGLSQGAYMGLVMGKFKGKVLGKEVMDVLKEVM